MALPAINYAKEYSQALSQAYINGLFYGDLYATENNGRYRFTNARTIEIPTIDVTGRTDANRDVIGASTRNYSNSWTAITLSNERKWETLIHPRDIDETNLVATIQNITQVFNTEQKFPEMDKYLISKLYAEYKAGGGVDKSDVITSANILDVLDGYSAQMDDAGVSKTGRILYLATDVYTILKKADGLTRTVEVDKNTGNIDRTVNKLGDITVISVPQSYMRTLYNFTVGAVDDATGKNIKALLVHPSAVITPVSYSFVGLSEPSATSQGKYVYYEEAHEDVFVMPNKTAGLIFNVSA